MHLRSFFPSLRSAAVATATVAALIVGSARAQQQPATSTTQTGSTVQAGDGTVAGSSQTGVDAKGQATEGATLSYSPGKKKKPVKTDKVIPSKDTRAENKKELKLNPLAGKDATLPDKALYDKALFQTSKGHFDVARLDLQTLLNTYPDSQYQMRAKLAIADSWYREGGTAALTQAEQEYQDFITFFPNVPEAAEAQMRVGDIYFKQMDVPDRDYSKAVKAEDAYRLMLKQYPESKLAKLAEQKLREVQEVMATREADLGAFYASHGNWPASIARFQTVVDTYPLYSHMDDVLIGIGDAYAAESRAARAQQMAEGPRAQIIQSYDAKAAAAYRLVVLDHSAAPHVEDAKERLETMGLPIPTPTAQQEAASAALEGSRAQYTMTKRLQVLFMHRPDTVLTANIGEAPLDDPAATTAPAVNRELMATVTAAFNPNGAAAPAKTVVAPAAATDDAPAPPVPVSNAPLALQDVAGPGEGSAGTGTSTLTAAPASSGAPGGNSVGVEVLSPGVTNTAPRTTTTDTVGGLHAVGAEKTETLAPIEKAQDAPDQVNDVNGHPQPAAQTLKPGEKAPKLPVDKTDESSSKKKPKKGASKLNPF